MLHIQHIKKAYGSITVLQIENLQLPKGVYWLKGENGSGKTTLLRSIAGLLPFDGSITVDGVSLHRQRRLYTQLVSFSEAEPAYPDFLTGQELVRFYLQTKGGYEQQLTKIAEALNIAPFLSQKTATYSSGMLKKLSLLLSFTGKPSLILLDEPFITLDGEAVKSLSALIALKSHQEMSFLISSHQELEPGFASNTLHIQRQTIETKANAASA